MTDTVSMTGEIRAMDRLVLSWTAEHRTSDLIEEQCWVITAHRWLPEDEEDRFAIFVPVGATTQALAARIMKGIAEVMP